MKEIKDKEKPLSEIYRLKGLEWADAQGAWYALSETKATTLARLTSDIKKADPKMSEARAEREARCMPEWVNMLEEMCRLNTLRLRLKIQLDSIDMAGHEKMSAEANARKERAHY